MIKATWKNFIIKLENFLDLIGSNRSFRLFAISISCVTGFIFRLLVIYYNPPSAGDFPVVHEAAKDFISGKNIYAEDIARKGVWATHQYGYPPIHLYLSSALYIISILVGESHLTITQYFLFCMDILTGLLIYKILDNEQFWNSFMGLTLWIFNPFALANSARDAKYEVFLIFLMLLSFFWLQKGKEKEATISYTISLLTKHSPLLMLPVFLYKSKNRLRNAGIMVGLFFVLSLPFLTKPIPYFQSLIFWLLGGGPAGDPGWGIFAQVHTLYSKIISIICLCLILSIIYIRFRQFDIYLIGFLVYIVMISFYWVLYTQYLVYFVPFLIIVSLKNLKFKKEIDDAIKN